MQCHRFMLRCCVRQFAQDNINCMIAGEKRFIFMHPSYKHDFEAIGQSVIYNMNITVTIMSIVMYCGNI